MPSQKTNAIKKYKKLNQIKQKKRINLNPITNGIAFATENMMTH